MGMRAIREWAVRRWSCSCRCALLCLLGGVLGAVGCLSSENPLPVRGVEERAWRSLFGTWVRVSGAGTRHIVHVFPHGEAGARVVDISGIPTDEMPNSEADSAVFEARGHVHGKAVYVSLRFLFAQMLVAEGRVPERRERLWFEDWLLVKCQAEGKVLKVWLLNPSALRKVITAGRLKGKVSAGGVLRVPGSLPGYRFPSIRLTSGPEELASFLRENAGNNELWIHFLEFRRASVVAN